MQRGQKKTDVDDRRVTNRFPIERYVRYKVLEGKQVEVGRGETINMSSTGVLFTTKSALTKGERVELAVSWPAQINELIRLKLVVIGRLVRTTKTFAAMTIESYEFKTRGSNGL